MNRQLFFMGIVGFASGVVLRSLFLFQWPVLGFALVIASIFLGLFAFERRSIFLIVGVFLVMGVLGAGRTMLAPTALPNTFRSMVGTNVSLEGTVVVDPDIREANQRITIEVARANEKTKILIVSALYPKVTLGERVRVSGKLEAPAPFATDGGRSFEYDKFLAKDGIFAIMQNARVEVVGPRSGPANEIFGALADVRATFVRALGDALPEPESSLAVGITAGGKQGLGKNLLQAFTIAGMLQIVVLSGYNVMIVAEGIRRLFGFLPKRFALMIAALGILAFILAAGAGSSAVRAGIMAGVALFARATGRSYDALRALCAALLVMLILNPLLLVYDPGLELSFVATLGLILLSPNLDIRFSFIKSAFMRDIVATTLAAQIFVLPLLLWLTGNLSLVALPANILAMPVIPLAMAFSAIAAVVAFLIPPLGVIAGLPAYVLLAYVIGVANVSASLPLAQIIIPAFSFVFVIAAYVLLWWFVRTLKRNVPPAKLVGHS